MSFLQKPGGIIALLDEAWYVIFILVTPLIYYCTLTTYNLPNNMVIYIVKSHMINHNTTQQGVT